MKNNNICTWKEESSCTNCNINNELACRWDKRILNGFYGIMFPSLLTTVIGMILVGYLLNTWWPLISFVVYAFLMFGFFEIRFLCSHCPYYAEEGKVLHCLGNHGAYKFWKYQSGPMNGFERFMMYFLVATIFFLFPLSAMGYGIFYISINFSFYGLISLLGMIGITLANFISSVSAVHLLKTFFCKSCINFSCPLNTVDKPIIDEYLRKNEVMRKAWEKSGWIID